jgi:urea carboxylase
MWNRFHQTADFPGETRWLLRFFDQIRFYPVSEQELLQIRDDFPRGKVHVRTEETTFRMADYRAFLAENRTSIDSFKRTQQAAFEAERDRWALLPPPPEVADEAMAGGGGDTEQLPPGATAIRAQVPGSVWQLAVKPGDEVRAGDKLVILETMKMETVVAAPTDGRVASVHCAVGGQVVPGQLLVALGPS